MEKKIWETPKAIILTRNKPEEAILEMCKRESGGSVDDYAYAGECYTQTSYCSPCRDALNS
jgi:hypothetical protein